MELENAVMMTLPEIEFLHEVISLLSVNSIVLEIGTAWGGSAEVMAKANSLVKIFTIDLFEDGIRYGKGVAETYNEVSKNLSKFDNITVMCGNAMTDFQEWNTEIDLYFEDGAHEDSALVTNLSRWTTFLKPGGILLLHDNNEFCPDVAKNIDILISTGRFEFIKQVGSLAMLKKKEKQ